MSMPASTAWYYQPNDLIIKIRILLYIIDHTVESAVQLFSSFGFVAPTTEICEVMHGHSL